MNLSAPFIQRPVMTTFVMLSIILAGIVAFFYLPVSDLPTIERPNINVSAGYAGASPEIVLNEVTIPLEKELMHVKGVQEISSMSSTGWSSISLTFPLSKDINEAIRDVQTAISRAGGELPNDLDPRPSYHLQEGSQEPIMYFLLTSEDTTVGQLRSYADAFIVPRLSRVEGVSEVMIYGSEDSVWIQLNPELMAARRVGFNEVIDAVHQKTLQMPLGSIQTGSKNLSIELKGTIQQAKELENILIGGGPLRLKDIAVIKEKAQEGKEFHFGTADKTSLALIMGIKKVSDGNTVAISKSVLEILSTVEKELPPSIHLTLWFDKAVWIKDSILDVQWTLLIAFVLVVLVIYFSLGRLSDSLIASTALPLSLVGTFIIMYLAHFSLDLLSLLALTLSVGFVVDDAIVVLENIVRSQEKGAPPLEASLKGSKQISFTILSMTLSLVAVFIPLLFMEGINGRLFREFSITLAVAILVSGFISLTLTPMLCSRYLSSHSKQSSMQLGITRAYSWLCGIYGKTLKPCFRYPKTIVMFALACMGTTIFLFSKLPVNLIPPEDRGYSFTIVNLPKGLDTTQVTEQQKRLEQLVQANPHIEKFISLSMDDAIFFVISLVPVENRPPQQVVLADLQQAFDAIPGIQTFSQPYQLINLDMEFGNAGQYQLVVRGMDFQEVEKAAEELAQTMQADPMFSFVKSDVNNDSPTLAMNFNEEFAQRLGFEKRHIQELLQNAYGQSSIGKIQKGATQERIYMELLPEYQDSARAPDKLYLAGNGGGFVPLKAFVEWEETLGAPTYERRDQLPSTTIRFSLVDGVAPNEGLARTEEIAAAVLPPKISGALTGAAKATASMIGSTLLLLLAAVVVMYVVLGILYESFIHPLTILSSLPFAGLGGVLTLFLFGEPISIFSVVGFLLLIGIVKKNGIMMVDYAVEAQKQGKGSEQAIYEACLVRFRPIMMTTIAAVAGAIPIAIGFGDGAEMRRGLGLVIAGGLLFSQLLTLYVTPILYLIFERAVDRMRNIPPNGGI